jgi:hypothetical protein
MNIACVCNTWERHSVTAAHVDLCIDNNSTWMDAFQFGKPDDLTWTLDGQTFELDVQLTPYDAVPLLHLDTANGRIFVDDKVQRVIHFLVDADNIQQVLPPGIYVYDLVMIDGLGVRVALMYGTLEVKQGVTYPP